ncbi:MAG: putative ABC transport system ATP-binding protein [Nitrospirae bacterium]|nr:MAG: putative ABC transport system ATP-binding protein [Nitrospirota bacterium]
MIKTENATKYFNRGNPDEVLAVNDVSIEVKEGDFAVFKGPSGSGKTTLLSLIGCMSRPTSGRVIVEGRDVSRLPERFMTEVRRNTFGFIFQQFHLIKGISVCDNVMLPVLPTDIKPSELRQGAARILENLGMSERIDFPVQKLSGGEQQRAAIARALINNPDIILADEPTAHLDTHLSEEFLSIMRNLQQQGKTIIIATHDPLVYDKDYVTLIIEMRDGSAREIIRN